MSTTYGNLPIGIRDAKLKPLSGVAVDLPIIRSLDVGLASDSTELTGDDTTRAIHNYNRRVEGSFESGGVNPAAVAVMIGGTAVTTGTGPTAITTVSVTASTNGGYFQIEGQMIGDDGGDLHVVIYKAKITSGPNWTFTGGEFALTSADFTGVANDDGDIMDLIFNATETAIATT